MVSWDKIEQGLQLEEEMACFSLKDDIDDFLAQALFVNYLRLWHCLYILLYILSGGTVKLYFFIFDQFQEEEREKVKESKGIETDGLSWRRETVASGRWSSTGKPLCIINGCVGVIHSPPTHTHTQRNVCKLLVSVQNLKKKLTL